MVRDVIRWILGLFWILIKFPVQSEWNYPCYEKFSRCIFGRFLFTYCQVIYTIFTDSKLTVTTSGSRATDIACADIDPNNSGWSKVCRAAVGYIKQGLWQKYNVILSLLLFMALWKQIFQFKLNLNFSTCIWTNSHSLKSWSYGSREEYKYLEALAPCSHYIDCTQNRHNRGEQTTFTL